MNYLNIETRTLRAPEYIGSEPVARATWLSVLGYCAEQENGGRIRQCRGWKDRQWQQTCGVTQQEVVDSSRLLLWDGDDLVVFAYPKDQERVVKAKRSGGHRGGKRSGEARRWQDPDKRGRGEEERTNGHPLNGEGVLQGVLRRAGEAETKESFAEVPRSPRTKGKGKKGKEMEEEQKEEGKEDAGRCPRPHSLEEVLAFCAQQQWPATDGEWAWQKWEGNGFTVGNKRMRDWKATLRSWNMSGYLPSQKAGKRLQPVSAIPQEPKLF